MVSFFVCSDKYPSPSQRIGCATKGGSVNWELVLACRLSLASTLSPSSDKTLSSVTYLTLSSMWNLDPHDRYMWGIEPLRKRKEKWEQQ